ncbi:MAG: hypothetical protein ABIY37_01585 [Devosia sp.]
MADSKPRSTGAVYRDEAADLMAAAARGTARPAPPDLELTARRAPPIVRPADKHPEPKRPLPYPEPVGINDNSGDAPEDLPQQQTQRRRVNVLQLAARIVIAPWYAIVAASSLGIIALFGRGVLGV